MTTASASGVRTRKMVSDQTISWEEQTLKPAEAIPVLIAVILDNKANSKRRLDAIDKLKAVSNWITGSEWVGRLVRRYAELDDKSEKARLLKCLVMTEDPSTFLLFARVLDSEEDKTLRFYAAGGFAQWNIRRGVAELLRLATITAEDNSTDDNISNEAQKALGEFDQRKGWRLLDEEKWTRIDARSDLDHKQKVRVYFTEVSKCFSENEHRFPDWKPGDPLPEIEPSPKAKNP